MSNILHFLFTLAFLHLAQSLDFWRVDLPEIKDIQLEKKQPIKVPHYYDKVQLCKLTGNIYSDTLSQLHNVKELRICESNIDNIESGALCSSSSVQILELDFFDSPKVPSLTKDIFENCNHIQELLLKFNPYKNHTFIIDNDILEHLTHLKNFYILGYQLNHLKKDFFKLPNKSLKNLGISTCDVNEIDWNTFEDLPDLKKIVLIRNKLTTLPLKLFKNNLKLKELILTGNRIKNLNWNEFEGLDNLEKLELTENGITSFDADKIAENLPNLKSLSIDRNPLTCKEKEAFVNELKNKLEDVEVTYKFDPGYYDSCEEE